MPAFYVVYLISILAIMIMITYVENSRGLDRWDYVVYGLNITANFSGIVASIFREWVCIPYVYREWMKSFDPGWQPGSEEKWLMQLGNANSMLLNTKVFKELVVS
jgi:hypothetical protein